MAHKKNTILRLSESKLRSDTKLQLSDSNLRLESENLRLSDSNRKWSQKIYDCLSQLRNPAYIPKSNLGMTDRLCVNVTLTNRINEFSKVVEVVTDRGCSSPYILLRDTDIIELSLLPQGNTHTVLADGTKRNMLIYSDVIISVTFSDGSNTTASRQPLVFETFPNAPIVAVSNSERVLCDSALNQLRLQQDYLRHRIIKAVYRL